jgi:hypothetical protein
MGRRRGEEVAGIDEMEGDNTMSCGMMSPNKVDVPKCVSLRIVR